MVLKNRSKKHGKMPEASILKYQKQLYLDRVFIVFYFLIYTFQNFLFSVMNVFNSYYKKNHSLKTSLFKVIEPDY